ncbi:MAG: type II toxin-antitoxin system RelE/ParE family toxin [Azonexus sp.]
MKLIVLNAAQAELEEAQAYYLQHATPRIAAAFLADYQNSASRLLQFPLTGTPVSKRLRILPLRHFPYSIIYQVGTELISIRAVAHQRRHPGYWGRRR